MGWRSRLDKPEAWAVRRQAGRWHGLEEPLGQARGVGSAGWHGLEEPLGQARGRDTLQI